MTDLESKGYFKVFCCVTWIDLGLKGKDPWGHQVIEFYPNLTPWETKQHFKRFLFRTLTPVPAHEMLTWQLVTLHVALWVLLDLEMESMWHQNKAANLFCKQRDVFIFPLTPGALAAPQLQLHHSHLTVKASETSAALWNSRKLREPLPSQEVV